MHIDHYSRIANVYVISIETTNVKTIKYFLQTNVETKLVSGTLQTRDKSVSHRVKKLNEQRNSARSLPLNGSFLPFPKTFASRNHINRSMYERYFHQ